MQIDNLASKIVDSDFFLLSQIYKWWSCGNGDVNAKQVKVGSMQWLNKPQIGKFVASYSLFPEYYLLMLSSNYSSINILH